MKCTICKTEKLSDEFPQTDVNKKCDHPNLSCLRCTVQFIEEHEKCPNEKCSNPVDEDVKELYKITLRNMFPVYETSYSPEDLEQSKSQETFSIKVLNGDYIVIPYQPDQLIVDLKPVIHRNFSLEMSKQRLKDTEEQDIKDDLENGSVAKLSDYASIKPGSTIYVYEELFAIPLHFNHVVFDLFWGYPSTGWDFLDASCLIFSGLLMTSHIDYCHTSVTGIWHSGDVMDDEKKQGHHTIDVKLRLIPSNITHLFFTLSAWASPTISAYPNPSLAFYQASDKSKNLCKTTFGHAAHSQAVIMCFASKKSGQWRIYNSGVLSAGNALDYTELIKTIQSIISKGI